MDLKLNYLNVDNSYACQLLFLKSVVDSDSDLAVIAEPYICNGTLSTPNHLFSYHNNRIAFLIKRDVPHRLLLSRNNIIAIIVEKYIFVGCYLSPNKPKYSKLDLMDRSRLYKGD